MHFDTESEESFINEISILYRKEGKEFVNELIDKLYDTIQTDELEDNYEKSNTYSISIGPNGLEENSIKFLDADLENIDLYFYEYLGYFKVDYGQGGTYEFQVIVNDSAELFIDGVKICAYYKPSSSSGNNTVSGSVTLAEGYHRFVFRYYEANGSNSDQFLNVNYKVPNSSSFITIPFTRFYYDPTEYGSLTSGQRFFSTLSIGKSISLDKDTVLGETFAGAGKTVQTIVWAIMFMLKTIT
jgi:hypothetical protein